jgi:rod shape-determining protein MreD
MRARPLIVGMAALLVAVVLQTTLVSRFRLVSPDLIVLVSILFALSGLRREVVLVLAFTGGLVMDLLGPTVLGLRATVATAAAFLAIRTASRVDLGPVAVALWVGGLTLVSMALFVLIGTLFGQGTIIASGLGRRMVLVPLANLVLSFPIAPVLTRMMSSDPRGVM